MAAADVARLAALAALWGGSFAFMRVAAPVLGPVWLAESRVALAFAALLIIALARGNLPSLRQRWGDYAVVGLINSALPFALFCFAEQYVSASMAAILNATSPFFSAIVAAIWLRDRLTPSKLAGMFLGIGGVALLVGWQSQPPAGHTLVAVLACLSAALCYAVASVYVRSCSRRRYHWLRRKVRLHPWLLPTWSRWRWHRPRLPTFSIFGSLQQSDQRKH